MVTKPGAQYIWVFCPAHKKSFQMLPASQLLCESGKHALTENFLRAEFWEHCCDCQRFWPSDLKHGGQSKPQCVVCERQVVRRYLCAQCKLMCVESDDPTVKRKRHTITETGAVSQTCPGCGCAPEVAALHRHECPEAGATFMTARNTCPFCEEPLTQAGAQAVVTTSFPIAAEAYLAQAREQKVHVRHDERKSLLVKDANGKGALALVHEWGVPGGALYLIPRRARLNTKDEFYNYYGAYYGCYQPAAGQIWIVKPALVDRVAGGWRLREKGLLEVRDGAETIAPAQAATQKSDRPASVQTQTTAPTSEQVGTQTARAGTTQQATSTHQQGAATRAPAAPRTTTIPSTVRPQTKSKVPVLIAGLVVCLIGLLLLIATLSKSGSQATNINAPGSANSINSNGVNKSASGNNANGGNSAHTVAPSTPANMVYVPGGEFEMGGGDDPLSQPQHKVRVQPFFIDKYEVTCTDYAQFISATGHHAPAGWQNGTYPNGWAHRPITGIDWDAANAYAQWAHKRLPTEAEWEFAARGTDGRRYPWGNDWRAAAANADRTAQGLAEVGANANGLSPFGAYDMVGNAWEWTATDFDIYPGGDAARLPKQVGKVIRGGCYLSGRDQATTTYRGNWTPRGARYDQTGFRCVMDITAQPVGR